MSHSCSFCQKVFSTIPARKRHEKTAKTCLSSRSISFVCSKCLHVSASNADSIAHNRVCPASESYGVGRMLEQARSVPQQLQHMQSQIDALYGTIANIAQHFGVPVVRPGEPLHAIPVAGPLPEILEAIPVASPLVQPEPEPVVEAQVPEPEPEPVVEAQVPEPEAEPKPIVDDPSIRNDGHFESNMWHEQARTQALANTNKAPLDRLYKQCTTLLPNETRSQRDARVNSDGYPREFPETDLGPDEFEKIEKYDEDWWKFPNTNPVRPVKMKRSAGHPHATISYQNQFTNFKLVKLRIAGYVRFAFPGEQYFHTQQEVEDACQKILDTINPTNFDEYLARLQEVRTHLLRFVEPKEFVRHIYGHGVVLDMVARTERMDIQRIFINNIKVCSKPWVNWNYETIAEAILAGRAVPDHLPNPTEVLRIRHAYEFRNYYPQAVNKFKKAEDVAEMFPVHLCGLFPLKLVLRLFFTNPFQRAFLAYVPYPDSTDADPYTFVIPDDLLPVGPHGVPQRDWIIASRCVDIAAAIRVRVKSYLSKMLWEFMDSKGRIEHSDSVACLKVTSYLGIGLGPAQWICDVMKAMYQMQFIVDWIDTVRFIVKERCTILPDVRFDKIYGADFARDDAVFMGDYHKDAFERFEKSPELFDRNLVWNNINASEKNVPANSDDPEEIRAGLLYAWEMRYRSDEDFLQKHRAQVEHEVLTISLTHY